MPNIQVDPHYWLSGRRDYPDWPKVMGRELLQNSLDAGATVITVSIEGYSLSPAEIALSEDGVCATGCVITVTDNGVGMSRGELLRNLLRLGGTGKGFAEGNVGGYGVAKTLLLFSQIKWEVTSQGWHISGSRGGYTTPRRVEVKGRGTTIRVWSDSYAWQVKEGFYQFVSLSSPSHPCLITLNGVEVKWLDSGNAHVISNTHFGKLTVIDKLESARGDLVVRTQGQFMFKECGAVGKDVFVDLSDPVKQLQANRCGLRYPFNSELSLLSIGLCTEPDLATTCAHPDVYVIPGKRGRLGRSAVASGFVGIISPVNTGLGVAADQEVDWKVGLPSWAKRAHSRMVSYATGESPYWDVKMFSYNVGGVPEAWKNLEVGMPTSNILVRWRNVLTTLVELCDYVVGNFCIGLTDKTDCAAAWDIMERCILINPLGSMVGSDIDLCILACHELAHMCCEQSWGHDEKWGAIFHKIIRSYVGSFTDVHSVLADIDFNELTN